MQVKDLEDKKLLEELSHINDQIEAEYNILKNYKAVRKEIQDEINLRFSRGVKQWEI